MQKLQTIYMFPMQIRTYPKIEIVNHFESIINTKISQGRLKGES